MLETRLRCSSIVPRQRCIRRESAPKEGNWLERVDIRSLERTRSNIETRTHNIGTLHKDLQHACLHHQYGNRRVFCQSGGDHASRSTSFPKMGKSNSTHCCQSFEIDYSPPTTMKSYSVMCRSFGSVYIVHSAE